MLIQKCFLQHSTCQLYSNISKNTSSLLKRLTFFLWSKLYENICSCSDLLPGSCANPFLRDSVCSSWISRIFSALEISLTSFQTVPYRFHNNCFDLGELKKYSVCSWSCFLNSWCSRTCLEAFLQGVSSLQWDQEIILPVF